MPLLPGRSADATDETPHGPHRSPECGDADRVDILRTVAQSERRRGRTDRRASVASGDEIAKAVAREVKRVLAEEQERPERPSRFWLLLAGLVVSVAATAVTAVLASDAVTEPPPGKIDLGAVGMYMPTDQLDQSQLALLEAGVITISTNLSQLSSNISYEIDFPPALHGKRYVLGFTGSAVIHNLTSDDPTVTTDYEHCPGMPTVHTTPADSYCLLVYGRVPTPTDTTNGDSYCFPDQKDKPFVAVSLSGTALTDSSPDWAHHITSLPYLGYKPELVGQMEDIGDIDQVRTTFLGSDYAGVSMQGCQILTTDPAWTDLTPSWPADLDKGNVMIWRSGDEGAALTVVSTERDAASDGDMLFAAVGIAGGAVLALVYPTIKSGLALRRRRQRSEPPRRAGVKARPQAR